MTGKATLRVFPIVEGHGEVQSIRILLGRIASELLEVPFVDVLQPLRRPRTKLTKEQELARAVELGALKLAQRGSEPDPTLILVLLDSDKDPPCELGPELLAVAREATDRPVACVLANPEYETWFVAAAESLGEYLDIKSQDVPEDPETARLRKAWVQKRFRGPKYSETVDQPGMTTAMDLELCRRRSRSFDKLCRELEKSLAPLR